MYGLDLFYYSIGKFFVISWFKCYIIILFFILKCMLIKVIYIYIFLCIVIDFNFVNI